MGLNADLADVRTYVYRSFADEARVVTPEDVGAAFSISAMEALSALRELHEAHLVVLDPSLSRIVMAHPWAASFMGFVVASASQKWWGGCAWDSFAIPALVDDPCLVATRCPACSTPLVVDVMPDQAPMGDLVAHFVVPVKRMWDDVVLTCSNQLLFCDEQHVDQWLAREGHSRGAILDLGTLWQLATGWYEGRLARDYRRRTASEAAAFFGSLGLAGDFWATA